MTIVKKNESIFCKIEANSQRPINVGPTYRPPKDKLDEMDKLCKENKDSKQ